MFLPTSLLLLVLLAAVPPSSNAAPLPSSFDPLYLSLVSTASVINNPSEPPPRQATRSAEVNGHGLGGFAVAAAVASSSSTSPIAVQEVAITVFSTVYESRVVTKIVGSMRTSAESQVQQQQVVPSVASSSSPVVASSSSSSSPTTLPPPFPSIIIVTQTVTLPPPQHSVSASVTPLVDAVQPSPSASPSPSPFTRTDPQLTPIFPTTTWAQPATYSDLSSFKIKKFAVGKENFQVVQGIPAWATQGYVVSSPAVTSSATTAPDADKPVATETPGLLDGLLGALGRRGRGRGVARSFSHSRFHSRRSSSSPSSHHHLSLPLLQTPSSPSIPQPLIARSPPSTPIFAWDNLTSSALQILFPSQSANPSAFPIGGGDFYAQPYDFASASNMTLEYSVFFPVGFEFVKGGKLPGLYGGKEGCSGGDEAEECWSSRMMWRKEGRGEIYLYVPKDKQTPRLCSTPPQSVCDSTYGLSIGRGSFSFKTGGWTTVRQDIWMNTPGLNDGGFNIFIDGQFIFSANDVLYRNAPAPASLSPPPSSDPAPLTNDSSTLSKRYDDGFYHLNSSVDDGQYHPGGGGGGGQSVQSESTEDASTSVASATQQDVPSTMEEEQDQRKPTWEEIEEGQSPSDETSSEQEQDQQPSISLLTTKEEDQPSSNNNDVAVEGSSPSSTEDASQPPPASSDQEIPAPPPPPPSAIEPPSSSSLSSPSSGGDFTGPSSSSGGSSFATDDGSSAEGEESTESDQEEQTEGDEQQDDASSITSSSDEPTSPSSPPPPPEPTTTTTSSPPLTSTPSPEPPAIVEATSPSHSPSDAMIPPPPPPPSNDPEQSPSPEPVPTPGDNTDGDMLGFTGIFFSTFFGGHGADWASPSDQEVWFSGFSVRTNA